MDAIDANSMLRAALLITVLIIAGCHAHQPDFMTRARENCSARQKRACILFHFFNGLLRRAT